MAIPGGPRFFLRIKGEGQNPVNLSAYARQWVTCLAVNRGNGRSERFDNV